MLPAKMGQVLFNAEKDACAPAGFSSLIVFITAVKLYVGVNSG